MLIYPSLGKKRKEKKKKQPLWRRWKFLSKKIWSDNSDDEHCSWISYAAGIAVCKRRKVRNLSYLSRAYWQWTPSFCLRKHKLTPDRVRKESFPGLSKGSWLGLKITLTIDRLTREQCTGFCNTSFMWHRERHRDLPLLTFPQAPSV